MLNINNVDGVYTVTLNRPEIHNAFNEELILKITSAFKDISSDDKSRLVVITGEGKSFCAGADLNWMSSMVEYSMEENKKDSEALAEMFEAINECPVPVLGKINGHALGGGVGVVSVCDYAHTNDKALFGFTEVRLGLIPAVISPFCIAKIGESQARAWFLSGERFDGNKAQELGLVHSVSSLESFEEDFEKIKKSFLKAGPIASREAKKLIKNIVNADDLKGYTCSTIAKIRISDEGQEGMKSLLEKRKANWM